MLLGEKKTVTAGERIFTGERLLSEEKITADKIRKGYCRGKWVLVDERRRLLLREMGTGGEREKVTAEGNGYWWVKGEGYC